MGRIPAPKKDINHLSEPEFISHILCTICDYARANGYPVTDTVKTMGENLVALTEIATFDSWKGECNGKADKIPKRHHQK